MSRFGFLIFSGCAILGGCAIGNGPSLTSFSLNESNSEPISPEASVESPAAVKTADGSVLGNIWDNFSSAFRPGEKPAPAPAPKIEKGQLDSRQALSLVNAFRATKGLKPLTLEPRANQAADMLAAYMAKQDHMSHYGPDGEDVGKRLVLAGYQYHLAAENIGAGQTTLSEIIKGWENSPPHRRNLLLADAKHMGIALDYNPDSKYKTFWTLVIASP